MMVQWLFRSFVNWPLASDEVIILRVLLYKCMISAQRCFLFSKSSPLKWFCMILTLPFVTVICSAVLCLLSFNFHTLVGPLDVLPSAVEFNFFLYFDSYLANPGRSLQYIYILPNLTIKPLLFPVWYHASVCWMWYLTALRLFLVDLPSVVLRCEFKMFTLPLITVICSASLCLVSW